MDPTEDLSARVLLKHILTTESPRTPITSGVPKAPSTSATRRSSRLSKKDAGPQTPQNILRRSLKHKIHESITRKSLSATRRMASVMLRKTDIPATASVLLDDGDTPRHILMNILRTDPVRSPVVHEKVASEEPQPSPANSSRRPSIELSGLDLTDITIGHAASTAKGLSRKRPRRSLNVTAFEKRLKDGDDVEEENEKPRDDLSCLSLSSSTSLSLKTPVVDVRTEKRCLQRRVSNRRKVTEEEFGAAVNKRQMGGVSSFVLAERGLGETAYSEGFTLGLSKLGEPDITTDIVHCNTALYAQPDAMTSNFSIVATQDKPTVIASQLQKHMREVEQMEVEQSKLGKEKSMYAFLTEEEVGAEPQNEGFSQLEEDAAESQKQEGKSTADGQPEDSVAMLKSEEEEGTSESQTGVRDDTVESEEEENRVEAQTEEEGAAEIQTEEDAATMSQSGEEEDAADFQTKEEESPADSQTEEEEEGPADSQTEEEEEGPADSQTEEEEEGPGDSQTEEEEEGPVDSQMEEDAATRSQSGEEEDAADFQTKEEESPADSQTEEEEEVHSLSKEDVAARSQSEEEEGFTEYQSDQEHLAANSQSEEDGGLVDSQPEAEHDGEQEEEDGEQASKQLERDLVHISRRTHRSEGGLVVPVSDAAWSDDKSKAHSAVDLHSSLGMGRHETGPPHFGVADLDEPSTHGQTDASCTEAEPDADKENSFRGLDLTHDIEDNGHLSDDSPEEAAAAQDPADQEGEWEDDEDGEEREEVPSKTPAFVREKRRIFHPVPLASPSVFKNIQASSTSEGFPAPKPKQVRARRAGPAKKEGGLPKSYLMGMFKHFTKTKVSADVYPVLKETMDKFFERLAEDLETYAIHAKRKTIEVEDAELLLKRQGYVNEKVPVEVLIEKYLRMDQRKLLIPIATSGNVVIPKKR